MSADAEQIIAEAERYAAESALRAEHGPLVDDLERQLRASVTRLQAIATLAQDAMAQLYQAARAHAAVHASASRQLAAVMPQRYREGEEFELHGIPWRPLDAVNVLRRTVDYVLLDAEQPPIPPAPPGPVPPAAFSDEQAI